MPNSFSIKYCIFKNQRLKGWLSAYVNECPWEGLILIIYFCFVETWFLIIWSGRTHSVLPHTCWAWVHGTSLHCRLWFLMGRVSVLKDNTSQYSKIVAFRNWADWTFYLIWILNNFNFVHKCRTRHRPSIRRHHECFLFPDEKCSDFMNKDSTP